MERYLATRKRSEIKDIFSEIKKVEKNYVDFMFTYNIPNF